MALLSASVEDGPNIWPGGVLPCVDPSRQESVAIITATHVVGEMQLHFPALSRH